MAYPATTSGELVRPLICLLEASTAPQNARAGGYSAGCASNRYPNRVHKGLT